ncbi:septal ring lytic transglycosylase RlpA family protein [Chelativorans alearense]|uniref:septal ring lytic transglycosylase RlpA family protein n=1 Tax=Chelativorans alearense TaxID=2681495 RepID=UPI0013D63A72|nr:septal ring lytic transglycosylase RlpA family protein [Chelativorans alearense]
MRDFLGRRAVPALAATACIAFLPAAAHAQCGSASWYALTSKTASGERMNPAAMTAAHRSLPFGTNVKVVNRKNGRAVTVRINDRGPFVRGRILDLSKAAASKLGFLGAGHTQVCLEAAK